MNETNLHDLFKALSEPIRLRILVLLAFGELCICDLVEVLSLPQSTVSRHMSRLKLLGLVKDRRQGKWIFYRQNEQGSDLTSKVLDFIKVLQNETNYLKDIEKLKSYQKSGVSCSPKLIEKIEIIDG